MTCHRGVIIKDHQEGFQLTRGSDGSFLDVSSSLITKQDSELVCTNGLMRSQEEVRNYIHPSGGSDQGTKRIIYPLKRFDVTFFLS